jgi:putative endonuclease
MEFYVYIIYSEKLDRYYVGTTDNPQKRLDQHNSGSFHDAFTRKGIPWSLFLVIDGLESKQAYKIESHIKKMKSRKYLKDLVKFPAIIEKLKLRHL